MMNAKTGSALLLLHIRTPGLAATMPRPGFTLAKQQEQRKCLLMLKEAHPTLGATSLAKKASEVLGWTVSESTARGVFAKKTLGNVEDAPRPGRPPIHGPWMRRCAFFFSFIYIFSMLQGPLSNISGSTRETPWTCVGRRCTNKL